MIDLQTLQQHDDGWSINPAGHLQRQFEFDDFALALACTNRLGAQAEQANHHPDIHLAWGKVVVEIWTHSINKLSPADYRLAREASRLYPTPE